MSSTDSLCPYCNTYSSEHDYEHLARECYPARIEALESKRDTLAAQVEQYAELLKEAAQHIDPYNLGIGGEKATNLAFRIRMAILGKKGGE